MRNKLTQMWLLTLCVPPREPGTMIDPWPTPWNAALGMWDVLYASD